MAGHSSVIKDFKWVRLDHVMHEWSFIFHIYIYIYIYIDIDIDIDHLGFYIMRVSRSREFPHLAKLINLINALLLALSTLRIPASIRRPKFCCTLHLHLLQLQPNTCCIQAHYGGTPIPCLLYCLSNFFQTLSYDESC